MDSKPEKGNTQESRESREASKSNAMTKNKLIPNKLKLFGGKNQIQLSKKPTQVKSAERVVNQQHILKDAKTGQMPQTSKSQQQQTKLVVKQKIGIQHLMQNKMATNDQNAKNV